MSPEKLGMFGEAIAESICSAAEFTYIPISKLSKSSPLAKSRDRSLILTDFDVLDLNLYLDAKAKTKSILFRMRNEVRHGINRNHYECYCETARLAHKQAGLLIVELYESDGTSWSGSVLVGSFQTLGKPVLGFNEPVQKVYWPRERFTLLGSFSQERLLNIARGRSVPNFREPLITVFAPAGSTSVRRGGPGRQLGLF